MTYFSFGQEHTKSRIINPLYALQKGTIARDVIAWGSNLQVQNRLKTIFALMEKRTAFTKCVRIQKKIYILKFHIKFATITGVTQGGIQQPTGASFAMTRKGLSIQVSCTLISLFCCSAVSLFATSQRRCCMICKFLQFQTGKGEV